MFAAGRVFFCKVILTWKKTVVFDVEYEIKLIILVDRQDVECILIRSVDTVPIPKHREQ